MIKRLKNRNNKLRLGIMIHNRVLNLQKEGKSLEDATNIAKSEVCSTMDNRIEAIYLRKWYNNNISIIENEIESEANQRNLSITFQSTKIPPHPISACNTLLIQKKSISTIKKEKKVNSIVIYAMQIFF